MRNILFMVLSFSMLQGCNLYHVNTYHEGPVSYHGPPEGCRGNIPVVVHWGAGWHTSVVIPNRDIKVSHYFELFPYLEINWGDRGFYKAGASQWAQVLAAPKAIMWPSSSVMYFVGIPEKKEQWCRENDAPMQTNQDTNSLGSKTDKPATTLCYKMHPDYEELFRYYDAHVIWVTTEDFAAITQKINQAITTDSQGNPVDLGNAYLFDPAYVTNGRFFTANDSYFGLINTCNTWTADLLAEIDTLKTIKDNHIYRANAIFDYLQEQVKSGNACIEAY